MAALERYDVLDTPAEESFDRITRLTKLLFDVPIATIALLDGHRQWFKSRQGVPVEEAPRVEAICDVTITAAAPLVVPDTLADPRFREFPLVVGGPKIRFYAGAPLRTPDGQNIGTICAMDTRPRDFSPQQVDALRDLARIVIDELELRILATTDPLTGALSRRGFRDEGGRMLALALRHRQDISCLMLDVDHFKAVNDRHGHVVGDLVLALVAETCRGALRKTDLLGRLGGEEFGVLLPHTGAASAMKVAEKLRSRLAKQRLPAPALSDIAVTASFGLASLDRSVSDLDGLLKRADGALYVAKEEGRNRCVAWQAAEAAPAPNQRRRVFKAGRVTFNSGHSVIDCTVRSLSDSGASFDVISTAGLPEEFKLQIESDNLSRLSRVVARRDKHVEVEFV
ncbi:GGDEF domain-containing protein [Enterovirga sp. CN4-39]|uniref:GGDEF domain-containing protein n=1 Tax=Enterovirga sp. CN4-39 TaxID=3400910 RepID=UPI003C098208